VNGHRVAWGAALAIAAAGCDSGGDSASAPVTAGTTTSTPATDPREDGRLACAGIPPSVLERAGTTRAARQQFEAELKRMLADVLPEADQRAALAGCLDGLELPPVDQ
jgi:hypothetical protein